MRISEQTASQIKKNTQKHFGKVAKVFLFGSRTNDNQKGGDIDLYIVPDIKEDLFRKKIYFLSSLKKEIGEQKIDVILAGNCSGKMEKEVLKNGIEL